MREKERVLENRMNALEKRDTQLSGTIRALSGSINARFLTVTGSGGGDTSVLSGTINARFINLSGSVDQHIKVVDDTLTTSITSLSGTINARFASQPDTTALSGTINARFINLSGTVDQHIKAVEDSLTTSITATSGTINSKFVFVSSSQVEFSGSVDARFNKLSGTVDGHFNALTGTFARADLNRVSSVMMCPFFMTGAAGTKAIASASCYNVYMGKTQKAYTNATWYVRYRTTTAFTVGTGGTPWVEVGVATGSVVHGGNPSLSVFAYANALAEGTGSAGIKETAITGVTVGAGEDLWVLIGNGPGSAASQTLVVRGTTIADDLTLGVQGSRASTRPSELVGLGAATFTTDAFNVGTVWIALIV